MVYTMELSFNILKHANVTECESDIVSIAVDFSCCNYYNYVEMDYNKYINRNHCIVVVQFNEQEKDVENMAKFIRVLRRIKHVYVECIYHENVLCKIIYASSFYITNMDKSKVHIYKKFVKEKIFTEQELCLLQEVLTGEKKRALTV